MKKIMFNDKYGLTEAVLDGRKTMTRRIAYNGDIQHLTTGIYIEGKKRNRFAICDNGEVIAVSSYYFGEVVAIAQSYEDIYAETDINGYKELDKWFDKIEQAHNGKDYCLLAGTDNKMFVKAELMPHHIRITDIKVERLQDISEDDCLKEGILAKYHAPGARNFYYVPPTTEVSRKEDVHITPQEAFACLIDKVSGKGTWESNPWVFVYCFELI